MDACHPWPKAAISLNPALEDDYEFILKVIRHEGRTYETTPKTFAVHDEEELRDIIVAHLNGHYEALSARSGTERNCLPKRSISCWVI
jgi:hypothetical protein